MKRFTGPSASVKNHSDPSVPHDKIYMPIIYRFIGEILMILRFIVVLIGFHSTSS